MTTDLQLERHAMTTHLVGKLMGLQTAGGPVTLAEARRFADMMLVVLDEVERMRDVQRAAERAERLDPAA